MSGITFGSVGDIIAVGQIAWTLVQALNESRGSAKEYQGLLKELQVFDQALLQQNYENGPELEKIGATINAAIRDWRDTLLTFRLKVDKKYGTSLRAGGSGNWLRDASKKVLWLKEKDDILELRRKLRSASDTLTILVLAATGKSNRLTSTVQAIRVELVHGLLQESIKHAEEQMAQLRLMDEKLDSQARTSNMILTTVNSGVTYLTQVHAIVIDIKHALSLLNSHILAQQATPSGLGTHWQQEPVTLEDALGFIVPIPLELVNSWDMFDVILAKRFEKHPGHGKIQRGEYAIEEGSSGRELNRKTDLIMCLRPGQKIEMSVVFPERSVNNNHCPPCQTKSTTSSEVRTQCTSCRMWFQRVTEVDESIEDAPELRVELGTPDYGEQSNGLPPRPAGPIIRPADFSRVRMLQKLTGGASDLEAQSADEKLYRSRIEEDLRASGLDDEQIAEVLRKEKTIDPNRPTYTRFSRKYLARETLDELKIQYQIDHDPNYIIVKRWVPEYEQDFLWNHTTELRSRRDDSLTKFTQKPLPRDLYGNLLRASFHAELLKMSPFSRSRQALHTRE